MTFDMDEARFIVDQLKKEWAKSVVYIGEVELTKYNLDYHMVACPKCGVQIKLIYTKYGLFEGNCYSCIDKKEEAFAYVAMAVPFRPYIDIAYSYFRFFYPQMKSC